MASNSAWPARFSASAAWISSAAIMSPGKSRRHLDDALEAPGWMKARRSVSGWLVEPTTSTCLGGDGAVDQIEQEVHHRPHRQVAAPGADLPGLRELELLEEAR